MEPFTHMPDPAAPFLDARQLAKGKLAGAVLMHALGGLSLEDAVKLCGEGARQAWSELHSVAHFWAAFCELGTTDLAAMLRRSEQLLDAMQARPDIAHPDPWRCSEDLRRSIGLPPAAPWPTIR